MSDGSGDIFLCEDDLVISGLNLKTFKDLVRKRTRFVLGFNVKAYVEKGKSKRKAINLEVLEPSNNNFLYH